MSEISACPACDSVAIKRTTQRAGGGKQTTARWWCEDCGERFDNANWREPQGNNRDVSHGLARVLEQMGRAND